MGKIKGYVAEGFEPVRDQLEKMIQSGCEDHLQLCVYLDKKCIIDLHGSFCENSVYNSDSMQCVFSSGKSVAAIVVAQLVEKGLLDYNEKVHKYWPQFAQNGKENVTLADVLRHESGLAWLDHTFAKDDFFLENIKANIPGKVFEEEPPHFPGTGGVQETETKREYHYVTRGCILNEIVRRVDPKGRTIGEIIREDSNFAGIRVGLTDEELKLCISETTLSGGKIMRQSFRPKIAGRGIEQNAMDFFQMKKKGKEIAAKTANRPQFMDGLGINIPKAAEYINLPHIKKSELPSATFHASAKSLARLAAMMANQGQSLEEEGGNDLMEKSTWEKMHAEEKTAYDAAMYNNRTNFTQGGVNVVSLDENSTPEEKHGAQDRIGWVGWAGLGGSVFQWHPELKIGFAFTCSCLHWFDVANLRGGNLQKIVVKCLNEKK